MILVGAMAAAIWGAGWATGAPRQARLIMLALLLTIVVALHVVLPDGHPLREATGGEASFWLIPLILAAAAWAYRQVFLRVRQEAARRQPPASIAPTFSGAELSRYARHVALREVGGTGQRRLKEARVLVVGAGGLGAPALMYLGAAGVGTLGVIDDDAVESSNLARQVIFRDADIGRPKTEAATDALRAQNPFVTVRSYNRRLTPDIAETLLADYDLVLDGSDDWDTRALVNRAAVAAGLPLIAGAIAQWEGSVALWDPARGGPCAACAYPEPPAPGLSSTCAEAGVAGPLPGVIGTLMALEALKALTGAGEGLRGRMLVFDGLHAEARTVGVPVREGCGVCGGKGRLGGPRAP